MPHSPAVAGVGGSGGAVVRKTWEFSWRLRIDDSAPTSPPGVTDTAVESILGSITCGWTMLHSLVFLAAPRVGRRAVRTSE